MGWPFTVKVVAAGELDVIRHQRKPRPAHVKNLTASIERIGFVVPLVVVEEERDGATCYVIIDGQHRFEAARSLGVEEFPAIVVPPELARMMMNLNVEKDLNIRERASVALSIYRELIEETPDLKEDEAAVVDAVEQAHNVTLGLAYEKTGRLAGSSFEPVLKRCDSFLDQTLGDAYVERQKRAQAVLDADAITKSIAEKIKEMGAWHSFVTQQILSYANPLKRKRGPVEFDEAFDGLIKRLRQLEEKPEKVLGQPVS